MDGPTESMQVREQQVRGGPGSIRTCRRVRLVLAFVKRASLLTAVAVPEAFDTGS
jgi:hypothetical protein